MELSMAYSSRTFMVFWILSPEPEAAAIAASMFPAERYTMDSTAKIWMTISASFSFITPKSPICFPNALRSFAYFEEVISTCFEPPTQEAPSVKRPAFRMLNATICPRPISCSRFSFGTLQFSRKIGVVELPWMPILCSSLPGLNPGKVRSTMNAVNFCKHDVDIREAAVGDPHFLAVQDVVRALFVQFGARQRVLRIRACLRLGKAVRADPLAGGELRQILFLLRFRAKVHNRQRADASVRSVRYREAAVNGKFFREHRGGDFVQPRAAKFLRHSTTHQTDFAALFHQLRHQPGFLVLQFLDERENFLEDKFFRRLPDQFLIVGQISGREHIAWLRRFQEKASSLCCGLGESGGGHRGRS